jgi:hypothetical protein
LNGIARIFPLQKSVFIPVVREIRVPKGLITAITNQPWQDGNAPKKIMYTVGRIASWRPPFGMRISLSPKPIDWKKTLPFVAFLLGVAILVSLVFYRAVSIAQMSPQSLFMMAKSETLAATVDPDVYPGAVWPPGYPLLLLAARKLTISFPTVNLLLFLLTILLVFVISKIGLPDISPIWPTLLFAICGFNYYNLTQFTSEALVLPLSLLILLSLVIYQRQQGFAFLLFLALCGSLLFITRYHAMLWLTPIIIGDLILTAYQSRKVPFWHWISFAVITFSPLGVVLLLNYRNTGFITGMNRFDWSSRVLTPGMEYFVPSTTFSENIHRTFKSFFLDFGSPFKYASHLANKLSYSASLLEWTGVLLFLVAFGAIMYSLFRSLKGRALIAAIWSWRRESPVTFLSTGFFFVYIIFTIIVWTAGNNDPLYTRYLYPSYVYFMLMMFSGYSLVKRTNGSRILQSSFVALFVYVFLVNSYKIILTILLAKKLV